MTQLLAMLASIVIEAVVALAWGKQARRPLLPLALVAAGATLVTHPFVWVGVQQRAEFPYWAAVLVAELLVVAVEAAAYALCARLPWRKAALVSLLANATSAAVGLLYYAVASPS